MTRRLVYGIGLWLTIACTAMTIASIALPRWVSYSPNGEREFSYGLHSRCSSVTGTCVPFPRATDCTKDPSFCNLWRTVGFLISFGVVIELCTLVSFVVIVAGGVQRRTAGWKVLSSLLLFCAIIQCAGMAIVAFLFDHHDRFWNGWQLDASWSLCTASWTILVLTSLGLGASALYLPAEGDYELIPDQVYEQDDQLMSRIAGWNDGYQRGYQSYQQERERDSSPAPRSVTK